MEEEEFITAWSPRIDCATEEEWLEDDDWYDHLLRGWSQRLKEEERQVETEVGGQCRCRRSHRGDGRGGCAGGAFDVGCRRVAIHRATESRAHCWSQNRSDCTMLSAKLRRSNRCSRLQERPEIHLGSLRHRQVTLHSKAEFRGSSSRQGRRTTHSR